MKRFGHIALWVAGWAAAMLCSSCERFLGINEDLSPCYHDFVYVANATDYEAEIASVLYAESDRPVAAALRAAVAPYFDRQMHDLDLSIYTTDDSLRIRHEQLVPDAAMAVARFMLPYREVMNPALANVGGVDTVYIGGLDRQDLLRVQQREADTIMPHARPIYAAGPRFDITKDLPLDSTLVVNLYMANSVGALVLDTLRSNARQVRVFLHGLADGFRVADSTYTFSTNPYVRTHGVEVGLTPASSVASRWPAPTAADTMPLCYYGAGFPSANGEGQWQFVVYTTMPDGKVTESVIRVARSLPAGELRVIRGHLKEDGAVEVAKTEASVSVNLDWQSGSEYNPTL